MQPKLRLALYGAVAALMLIASCGGSSGTLSADVNASADSSLSQSATANGWTAPADDSASGSLPSIPMDEDLSRSSSDVGTPPAGGSITVLGKDFIQQWNGTVDGDSLSLVPVDQVGGDHAVAFGLYKVSGLDGQRPTVLDVQCLPGGLDQKYAVGVANYHRARWEWFGPSNLPELEIDLKGRPGRHVSAGGNMYFIVVCFDANTAVFSQATLQYEPAGGDVPPGMPLQLRASDGLPGHIAVDWMPGQGNLTFEVFRADGPRDPGVKPEWVKLADTTVNHYDDQSVEPGKPYLYRVRATNDAGESVFTNPDPGFANPMGGLDGTIHGAVTRGDTGENVIGVLVALFGAPSQEPLKCMTNAEGRYKFEHLPAGLYIVAPMNPSLDFEPRFLTVGLNNEHPSAEPNFTARLDILTHYFWGFAYTMGGPENPGLHPLAGVSITVTPQDGSAPVTVQTGEAGFWMATELPVGSYEVSAAQDGMLFGPPKLAFIDGEHVTPALNFFGKPANAPPPGSDPGGGTM